MATSINSPITFTPALVDATPHIGQVLAEFMDSQVRIMTNAAENNFGKENVPQGAVLRLLNTFVTEEDTRQPSTHESLKLTGLSPELTLFFIERLKEARIIKDYDADNYELSHDTLAKHIAKQRGEDQATILDLVKQIKSAYFNYQADKSTFISGYTLAQIDNYLEPLQQSGRLKAEDWDYIEASRQELRRIERQQRIKIIRLTIIAIVCGLLALIAGVNYANSKLNQLKASKNLNLKDASEEALVLTTQALKESRTNPTEAWTTLDSLKRKQEQKEALEATGVSLTGFWGWLGGIFSPPDTTADSRIKTDEASFISRDLIQVFSDNPFYQKRDTIAMESLTGNNHSHVKKLLIDPDLQYYFMSFDTSAQIYANYIAPKNDLRRTIYDEGRLVAQDLLGNYEGLTDIALFSDQSLLWTAHLDNSIHEWNLTKEEEQEIYRFDKGPLLMIRPIADREALAVVDSIVYRVKEQRGQFVKEFVVGFDRKIRLLEVNPYNPNEIIVVKDRSNVINLVKIDESIARKGFINTVYDNIDLRAVSSVAFAPDGKYLFATFEGDVGKLWKRTRPDVYTIFRGHQADITQSKFSENGQFILTGSSDRTAILWNLNGGVLKQFVGHRHPIHTVGFLNNEKEFVYTADDHGDLRFWFNGVTSFKSIPTPRNKRFRTFAVSPMEDLVAFSCQGDPGNYYLWYFNEENGPLIKRSQVLGVGDLKGDVTALTFSQDGKHLVVGSTNDLVSIEEVSTGNKIEDYRTSIVDKIPLTDGISSLDLSPDGEWVAIGNRKLRDEPGRRNMVLLRHRKDPYRFAILDHEDQDLSAVNVVKFSEEGYLLAGCENGNIYYWDYSDVNNPRISDTLSAHQSRITSLDLSKAGGYLVTGSLDNRIILWEMNGETGRYERVSLEDLNSTLSLYGAHGSDVTTVDYKPFADTTHGEYFLSASADQTVKLWQKDGNHFAEVPNIISHIGPIKSAAFNHTGDYIITGGEDNLIKVWKYEDSGTLIRNIQGIRPW